MTKCSNNDNWTVQFPQASISPPEYRPFELDLRLNRHKFNYCRAEFEPKVGQDITKGITSGIESSEDTEGKVINGDTGEGIFDNYVVANVKYDGEIIAPLCFRSDWMQLQNDKTVLELKDPHYSLRDGNITLQNNYINLIDVYKKVIDAVPDRNKVITSLNSDPYPDDREDFVVAIGGGGHILNPLSSGSGFTPRSGEDTLVVGDAGTAVDFDNASPFEAINWLNQTYNLLTWPIGNGELAVGWPETAEVTHLAAPDDERVWRMKDPSIRFSREPLKTVLVQGPWIDEPGYGWGDTIDEMDSWFDGDDNRGGADVRAYGYAQRRDVTNGTELVVGSTDAKKDTLPDVAETALIEQMKRQTTGTVEIDPHNSGDTVSHPKDFRAGHFVRTVPDDDNFDNPDANSGSIQDGISEVGNRCANPIPNEPFLATSVRFESNKKSNWTIEADLSHAKEINPKTGIRYYNPDEDEWLDKSKQNDDGDLKGSFFGFEDI